MLSMSTLLLAYLTTALVAARVIIYLPHELPPPPPPPPQRLHGEEQRAASDSGFLGELFDFDGNFTEIFQWPSFDWPGASNAFVGELTRALRNIVKFLQSQSATLYNAISENLAGQRKKPNSSASSFAFPSVLLRPIGNFSFNFGFSFNFAANVGQARMEIFQLLTAQEAPPAATAMTTFSARGA